MCGSQPSAYDKGAIKSWQVGAMPPMTGRSLWTAGRPTATDFDI
jgi:hypothetical protein